jgi:hypothetical protein
MQTNIPTADPDSRLLAPPQTRHSIAYASPVEQTALDLSSWKSVSEDRFSVKLFQEEIGSIKGSCGRLSGAADTVPARYNQQTKLRLRNLTRIIDRSTQNTSNSCEIAFGPVCRMAALTRFERFLVLVLSIAVLVLVLDRTLQYCLTSLNQSSQHRYDPLQVGFPNPIQFGINRLGPLRDLAIR